MIPYGRQHITEEDIKHVTDVLRSDFLTQGPWIEKFERKIADYCGARYAVAVSNCTTALHIAYQALGLSEGKRLWTVPNSFVATSNAALYCGASVDFVDIDPQSYNMSVEALRTKLEQANKNDALPDIVVPVHFSGKPCDMKAIHDLSKQYGFKIVEDAAHAIGSSYGDTKTGSCTYSDATTFSFHPVKIITTGEGGVVTTNDENVYKTLLRLRTHGITRDKDLLENKDEGGWYHEQLELGNNYRITDLHAVLGYSQMDRLDQYVERRNYLARRYNEKLADLPLQLPQIPNQCHSSWHLYVIWLRPDQVKQSRKDIYGQLQAADIGVNVHYIPIHTQPYYKKLGFKKGDFPNAENYYNRAITLPLFPLLSDEQQDYICDTLHKILQKDI